MSGQRHGCPRCAALTVPSRAGRTGQTADAPESSGPSSGAADNGVRCRISGGSKITAVTFGATVTAAGRPAVLAHPRGADAWQRLRAWRTERATKLGKPAFVVFDDKTLRLVAAVLPTTEAGLLAIGGIGPVKLESYGTELISIAEQLRSSPG